MIVSWMAGNSWVQKSNNFMHELFARFRIRDTTVSDNGPLLTRRELEDVYKIFSIEHITTPFYDPRSNGQAERYWECSKDRWREQVLRNKWATLQNLLSVYSVTPSGMFLAELMFIKILKFLFNNYNQFEKHERNTKTTVEVLRSAIKCSFVHIRMVNKRRKTASYQQESGSWFTW